MALSIDSVEQLAWAGSDATPTNLTVTAPASCSQAIVFWEYWNGSDNGDLVSCTLDGNGIDQGSTFSVGTESNAGAVGFNSPASGSMTLAIEFGGIPAGGDGPVGFIVWLVDSATTWEANQAACDAGGGDANFTFTGIASGQLVLVMQVGYAATPAVLGGIFSQESFFINQDHHARLSSGTAAGTSVALTNNASQPAIVAVSVSEDIATGGSTPKGPLGHPFFGPFSGPIS